MALVFSLNCKIQHKPFSPRIPNVELNHSQSSVQFPETRSSFCSPTAVFTFHNSSQRCFQEVKSRRRFCVSNNRGDDSTRSGVEDDEVNTLGVRAALSMLRFYKREISPLLPNSCRYVPTCSEYSMIAYKKYGVAKGTILTAWRLCRCNPLGGSGFDPPRWFDETTPPEE